MSPPGRPKGEYRSAQHEGFPVSLPGRPKGEIRSAQHEGSPASALPAAPVLETPRLRLRQFTQDDWPAYAAMCADAEVMRYIGPGEVHSPEDAWRTLAAFLGHWALRGYGMWALEQRDSGALLGRVGYIDRPGWPGFELGWLLARGHWGHGYAREAAAVALRHAFEVLQRARVISLIRPGNLRSIAVAEAIGETLHGNIEMMGGQVLVYEARH